MTFHPLSQTVGVLQADIDCGERASCYHCPIALALNRELGGDWWVGEKAAREEQSNRRVPLPRVVQQFITDFDRGQSVRPFVFEMRIP